jgi:hypothetical protein
MYNQKYPNSLENHRNREYILYSLTLDIATLMGKESVKKDGKTDKAIQSLTKRLDRLLIEHLNTQKTKGW